MKRIINISLLLFGISFVIIVTSGSFKFECLFRNLFDICCPGCGLTRAFRSILNLDFYSAFKYSILGIPLFIFSIIICIGIVIDIIKNDNRTILFILNLFNKHFILIIVLIIITMTINNINGI